MRHKTEFIVLAVVICILTVYLMLRETGQTHYELPTLPTIKTDRITAIELAAKDRTVVLSKNDEKWFVGDNKYPADPQKVQQMLAALGDLQLTALASESKNYERYDLDPDNGIQVTAREASAQPLRQITLGKTAPTFQHTFVKLAKDPRVFHAQGDLRAKFDHSLSDLRDKTVLSFEPDQIQRLKVVRDKPVLTADRKTTAEKQAGQDAQAATPSGSAETKWQSADGRSLPQSEVEQLVSLLSRLTCSAYIEDQQRSDLKEAQLTLELENQDSTYRLQVFAAAAPEAERHPALSSQNDYPFFLSSSQVQQIQTHIEALTPDEEKK